MAGKQREAVSADFPDETRSFLANAITTGVTEVDVVTIIVEWRERVEDGLFG